jgi:hypothetical protein
LLAMNHDTIEEIRRQFLPPSAPPP